MNSIIGNAAARAFGLSAVALLGACGGGGSSSDSSPAVPDRVDAYVGTFVRPCAQDTWVTDATTGAVLYTRLAIDLTKASATKASARYRTGIYDQADCSGAARASFDVSGDASWITVDGSKSVGDTSVDLVTFSADAKAPGISAATVTINGVTYSGKYLVAWSSKDILHLVGNQLYGGDVTKPRDDQGYPTVLKADAVATRQ